MKYSETPLIDNVQDCRFELKIDEHTAYIDYKRNPGHVILIHTEVPEQLAGKGVGSAIVEKSLEFAKSNQLLVKPFCSFVQHYLTRHPAWQNIVLVQE